MGDERGGNSKTAGSGEYKAEPIIRSTNSGKKQDPYVAKATERAKVKIRDRMFQLNGGHIH